MPMTRKDYQETAKILKQYADEIHPAIFNDLVDEFSEMFEKDNPRFDPERFEKATGANNLEFNF
jgi:hypothetical protein